MNKKTKQRINATITAGVRPARLKGSEGQALKLGRSYWTIASGQPLPARGFLQQEAIREGNTEFIKLANGRKGATRKWDEAAGVLKFTKLGNEYYKLLRRNYVVAVPVVVTGMRKDGSKYDVKSHMPIEKIG